MVSFWESTDRYRSITKQFFRKADGVVVVYDITNELTFTAVRQWLASVQVSDSFPLSLWIKDSIWMITTWFWLVIANIAIGSFANCSPSSSLLVLISGTSVIFQKALMLIIYWSFGLNKMFFSFNGKWLSFSTLQEGAGEDIPIMLLGNKTDLDNQREIPLGVAEKLAKVSKSGPWSGTNGSPLNILSMAVFKWACKSVLTQA